MIHSTSQTAVWDNSEATKLKWQMQKKRKLLTLCFPFILHVSTSACLDFHVNFCKDQERKQLEPRACCIWFQKSLREDWLLNVYLLKAFCTLSPWLIHHNNERSVMWSIHLVFCCHLFIRLETYPIFLKPKPTEFSNSRTFKNICTFLKTTRCYLLLIWSCSDNQNKHLQTVTPSWILNKICILADYILDQHRSQIQVILITSRHLRDSASRPPVKMLLNLSANTLPPEQLQVDRSLDFSVVSFRGGQMW